MGTVSPTKIPASIANSSRDDLERLLVNSLHKLKARDKRIDELSKELSEKNGRSEEVDRDVGQENLAAEVDKLQKEVKDLQDSLFVKEKSFSERLSAETELLQQQNASIKEEAERELASERERRQQAEEKIVERDEQISRLEAEVTDLKKSLDEEVNEWKRKVRDAEDIAKGKAEEAEHAQRRVDDLEKEVNDMKMAMDKMQKTNMKEDEVIKDSAEPSPGATEPILEDNIDEQYSPGSPRSKALSAAQVATAAAHAELERANEEITSLKVALLKAEKEAEKSAEMEQQIKKYENTVKDYETEISQMKIAMASSQEDTKKLNEIKLDDEENEGQIRDEEAISGVYGAPSQLEEVNQSQEKIQALHSEISRLQSENEEQKKMVKNTEEKLSKAHEAEKSLLNDIMKLNARISDLEGNLATATMRVEEAKVSEGSSSVITGEQEQELKQAADLAKNEVAQIRKQVESERNRFKRALAESKRRLDALQKEKDDALASQKDAEKAAQDTAAAASISEQKLEIAKRETENAINELKEYKARAHALLKAKETELRQAKELALQEYSSALDEAQKAASDAEKTTARLKEELESANKRVVEEVAKVKSEFDASISKLQLEAASSNAAAEAANRQYEHVKLRFESLEERSKALKNRVSELEDENRTLNDMKEQLIVANKKSTETAEKHKYALQQKELELANALKECSALKQEIETLQTVMDNDVDSSEIPKHSSNSNGKILSRNDLQGSLHDLNASTTMQGPQEQYEAFNSSDLREMIDDVALVQEMSRKDRELGSALRRLAEAEAEIADLERNVELRNVQEIALKDTVRDMQREIERLKLTAKSLDVEYLKNILVRLFETGQEENLLPAVSKVLQFSPEEIDRCKRSIEKRQSTGFVGDGAAQMSSYISGWLGLPQNSGE